MEPASAARDTRRGMNLYHCADRRPKGIRNLIIGLVCGLAGGAIASSCSRPIRDGSPLACAVRLYRPASDSDYAPNFRLVCACRNEA
jgi:hypothetical protein